MAEVRPDYFPPEMWKSRKTHRFVTRLDAVRRLLVIEHPWRPARTGGSGAWEIHLTPPEDWRPGQPLFVSFYQSDNYQGVRREDDWTGTQTFIGHRFKQALVNGRLIWEQDVADEEMTDPADQPPGPGRSGYHDPYRVVEIPVTGEERITLTLRVVDKVGSETGLPGDLYKRFSWSMHNPDVAAKNFQTSVYFGDVHLTTRPEAVRPANTTIPAQRPKRRRRALPKSGIPFSLITNGHLPSCGYPVRTGVPMPEGAVPPGTMFALRDPRGKPAPMVSTEISHWPDGSVRWLLIETVARNRGRYRLIPDETPMLPEKPVLAHTRDSGIAVENGALTLRVGSQNGAGVFDGITSASGLDTGSMELSIKLNRVGWRDHFTGQRRSAVVEKSHPVCATLRLDGDMLDAAGQRFGPWRARIHIWAGLPCILVDWRLVNESDQAMAMLLDWSAQLDLPGLENARVDFGSFTPGYDTEDIGVKAMGHHGVIEKPRAMTLHRNSELSCRQERADQARIYRNTAWGATTAQAAGFVNLCHPDGGMVGAMRWFAEEYPGGIIVRPDRLTLATLPEGRDALTWPHDRPTTRVGRGESKQQTFALWLHDGRVTGAQAERFNALVQDAPRLFNQNWFIASRALETGPPRCDPELTAWAERIAPVIAWTGIDAPRLGHREYWDTAWSNDYRGRAHLGLIQYIETGDTRWFRYFDAACAHHRDVDIIRFCPEHPDRVGAPHSYGEDHTSCGPMGSIGLNCDSLLDHYLLTGDAESLDAVEGIARHLLRLNPWERSARNVGWPLAQIMRWYEQTGDGRFLAVADDLMEAIRAYVEPRRGIFVEIHGSYSYPGAVPFMTGYLAFGLMRYHQRTADAQALHLLRILAAGLFGETRTAPGRFRPSPFPEINHPSDRSRGYNALIGGLAGYLFHVTGEPIYAGWAEECYDGIVEVSGDPQISMDMLHLAGWMLHAVTRKAST